MRVTGSDMEGPVFRFDGAIWAQYVADPAWLWAGADPRLEVYRQPAGDPNPGSERRAAAALRLAIERRWPSNL